MSMPSDIHRDQNEPFDKSLQLEKGVPEIIQGGGSIASWTGRDTLNYELSKSIESMKRESQVSSIFKKDVEDDKSFIFIID